MRVELRLQTARHGGELLDRKQRIMANELERLQVHAGRSRQEWENRARQASVWLQRAAALDGAERIEAASPARPAEIEVQWGSSMGVAYPQDALCEPPTAAPAGGARPCTTRRLPTGRRSVRRFGTPRFSGPCSWCLPSSPRHAPGSGPSKGDGSPGWKANCLPFAGSLTSKSLKKVCVCAGLRTGTGEPSDRKGVQARSVSTATGSD